MRVTILTAGSRGDVQPYVALGLGLAARGHTVTIATHAPFEPFVRAHGLAFRAIVGDPKALLGGEAGLRWLESGHNPVAFVRLVATIMAPLLDEMLADMAAIAADTDALIFSPLTYPAAAFAQKQGIPYALMTPVPLTPTRTFPFVTMRPSLRLGGLFNRLSGELVLGAAAMATAAALDRWCRRTGHVPLRMPGRRLPTIYAFSPAIVPKPADWPATVAVTGTCTLPDAPDFSPDPALAAFLAAGRPPIYVGFGSMIGRDATALTALVCEALSLAGRRGILLRGWADLGTGIPLPRHVHVVADVPHAWLFPQMAALVHHGGAGTTAAGLRSGVPAVVAPYFADQPFWAARVHALGVGPAPIPQLELTASRLAAAIRLACDDVAMHVRADALGAVLRAEDGVGNACDQLEAWFTRR